MIKFTYDIPKNKMEIKTDSEDVGTNTKQIVITISICTTALIGFALYLEHRKYLIDNK